jgi:uncharacterized membrane protein YdjX (TVP38/TMEM64 family)
LKESGFARLSVPGLIGFLLTIMPLVSSSLVTAWTVTRQSEIQQWPLIQWVVITALLAVTSSLALTPPTFLALVYGFFLGWVGIPLLLGLNIAAIGLVFLFARLLQPELIRIHLVKVYPKTENLLKRFERDQVRVIFFTKLSPVLPFAATNLMFAIAGAKFREIILGGTAGMIPRTILAVWVGREGRDISYLLAHPNQDLVAKLLLVGLIIASGVGIGRFFKNESSGVK